MLISTLSLYAYMQNFCAKFIRICPDQPNILNYVKAFFVEKTSWQIDRHYIIPRLCIVGFQFCTVW